MKRRSKKDYYFILLVVIITGLTLGYALLTQALSITGITKINANNWSVYFDNLVPNSNNVSLSTGDSAAVIDSNTLTDITYTVSLNEPGDYYEFTVDVVNDGSIDAMINTITSKLNNVVIDNEHPVPSYLNYSVTYTNGVEISQYHLPLRCQRR